MADRSFYRQIKFPERSMVLADDEQWVVPKTRIAASLRSDSTMAFAMLFQSNLPAGVGQAEITVELGTAFFLGDTLQLAEQFVVIRFVVAVRSSVPRRQNSRCTAKCIDGQTTVFGQNPSA